MNDYLGNHKKTCTYGLFLLASVLYIGGVSPTIAWRDSAEFIPVVHTLGISHPAGSPTYILLTKPMTFLPIGSIALRVNMFSALLGALSIALLFALLCDLLGEAPSWSRVGASLSGALFLLLSESFWRFSEVAEVYTLQNCLLVILMMLLLKARQTRVLLHTSTSRFYWFFAFLYGLSAGVHATMALFAPAFLLFIGLTAPYQFRPKELAFLTFFFVLGFAVFLYLPLRSLGDPVFHWSDPQTWQRFLAHLSDRKDAAVLFLFSASKLWYQIRVYLANLSNEFFTLGLILGLLGCLYICRIDKPLALLLGLVFLGNVSFFIRLWTVAFGFLPSFVIFAVWIGYGVQACLRALAAIYQRRCPRIPQSVVRVCLLGGIAVTLGTMGRYHAAVAMQTDNYSTELYGQQLLAQLPADAILFSQDAWFTLLYLQHVERRRPDLTVLLQGAVFFPQYFAPLSKARFPDIRLTSTAETIAMSTWDYFWYLSRINQEEHPLFWDPEPDLQKHLAAYLFPQGLLFAFNPYQKVQLTSQVLQTHQQLVTYTVSRIAQGDCDGETSRFLARKLQLIGLYFKQQGFLDEATNMYQIGLRLRPNDDQLRSVYGSLLLSQGLLQQALVQFNMAYNENPASPTINRKLGIVMLNDGNDTRAAYFFERARSLGDTDGDLYLLLGETYIRLGRFPEARDALRTALELSDQPTTPYSADDHRQAEKTWARANLHHLEQGIIKDLIPLAQIQGTTR
jgi:tetratricopeptide (TPR) repeat protein